ncbi:MAG: cytochrome c [Myxococcota bacterium]|nr:cytochrome c [Myxococcota bacterium]
MYFLLSTILWAEVPKKLPPSRERGEDLYRDLCWQCHGAKALGDGPLADKLHTKPPPLAGVIPKGKYRENIDIIQRGIGSMPAYEQLIDRHDSKRILQFLSGLDPKTGLGAPSEEKQKDSTDTKDEKKVVDTDKKRKKDSP